jgi:uncharacterized protein
LTGQECQAFASLYPNDANFRSRVVMASHGFGRGEHKYFSNPLPSLIGDLRTELYPWLAPVSSHNRWNTRAGPMRRAALAVTRRHAPLATASTTMTFAKALDDLEIGAAARGPLAETRVAISIFRDCSAAGFL